MERILTLDNINKTAKEMIKQTSKRTHATIIALQGDLGAGKTTIAKEISKLLGVKDNVSSPTFVIMKVYKTTDKRFKKLIHIDAYRLNKGEELLHLGWEEMIKSSENLIIIEWPENVKEILPKDVLDVRLEHKDEKTRTIKFWYN